MEKKSLTYLMAQEGLTTLRMQYDGINDVPYLQSSKDWDPGFNWSLYNREFYVECVKSQTVRVVGDIDTRALFEKHGLSDYLKEIYDLIIKGGNFGIECFYNQDYNIQFLGIMSSRTRGINNTRHSVMHGGIRRHPLSAVELEVIADGLNLGRAMTYKNIAGQLQVGGGMVCVKMDELDVTNLQHVGFLGFCLDELRCAVTPDMGFPAAMTDAMRDNGYSVQYTCGLKGPLGSTTGKPAAYGTYLSLVEATKFHLKKDNLDGMSFAIQGLGQVGWPLAAYLAERAQKAKLYVSDINEATVNKFVTEFKAKGVEVTAVKPEEILFLDVDVICPCAGGGVIDQENIPKLKCKMILGGANNQLKAGSIEEEIALARLIADRGILYQIDWLNNTAGLMFSYEDYCYQKEACLDRINANIERILPENTRTNLQKAKELGITPTECAYKTFNP